jgi:hypothetical protein
LETKDPKSTESAGGSASAESKDPKSDATSSETLSEIEETEKVKNPGGQTGGRSEGSMPSPDGAFDEGRRGDGLEDAGPM